MTGGSLPPNSDNQRKVYRDESFKNTVLHEASGQEISVPPSKPSYDQWDLSPGMKKEVRSSFEGIFGEKAKDWELFNYRICWDAVTPTQDPLICEHPHAKQLFLVTGGSFHGYKFLPIIGKYVVEMLDGTLKPELAKITHATDNGNSKHEPSIKAHIDGLLRNGTPSSPRFLIRLGGTGAIADWADSSYYGEKNPRVWNDIHDIEQLTSLPDTALHRNIEKIVQKAAVDHGDRLKCAIICSCGVYGPGKGPGRAQSQLVPLFCDEIINNTKRAFYTQSGGNARSWVHIDDLVAVYIKLVEAAAAGGGNADWGHGYYFTATQEVSQLDFATAIGRILKKHGVIEYEEPVQLPLDDIWKTAQKSKWRYTGIYAFACNTRTVSERAGKVLGYEPKAPSLFDCLEEDVLAAVRRGA